MPHSESPGSSPPVPTPTSEEFEKMDQAQDGEQSREHNEHQDAPMAVKDEPQDDTNGDITMADVHPLPDPAARETNDDEARDDAKKEVKLEDLFADVDSDDEFPSTSKTNQSNALPTSSPGPASSPDQEYVLPSERRR